MRGFAHARRSGGACIDGGMVWQPPIGDRVRIRPDLDGRCPDGAWADATTKLLREGSAGLLKAAEAKDAAAAKAAMGSVLKSCKSCHDAHKKDH